MPFYNPLTMSWVLAALLSANLTQAESHPHKEVVAALGWELPTNECSKPRLMAQSSNVVDGKGAREITDVDSYTIERYNRKEKRWQKCLNKYKERLMKDFERLKGSAQHGLTQQQANQILTKMALIQQVYMSHDGLPEETVTEKEKD